MVLNVRKQEESSHNDEMDYFLGGLKAGFCLRNYLFEEHVF